MDNVSVSLQERIKLDINKYVESQKAYVDVLNGELGLDPPINQTKLSRTLTSMGLTTRKGRIEKISTDVQDKDRLVSLLNKHAGSFIVVSDRMVNIEIVGGYGLTVKNLIKKIYDDEICGNYMDEDGNLLIILRKKFSQAGLSKLLLKEAKVPNLSSRE